MEGAESNWKRMRETEHCGWDGERDGKKEWRRSFGDFFSLSQSPKSSSETSSPQLIVLRSRSAWRQIEIKAKLELTRSKPDKKCARPAAIFSLLIPSFLLSLSLCFFSSLPLFRPSPSVSLGRLQFFCRLGGILQRSEGTRKQTTFHKALNDSLSAWLTRVCQ